LDEYKNAYNYNSGYPYVLSANFVVKIEDATETMTIKITNIYGLAWHLTNRGNWPYFKIHKEGPDIIPVRTTSERISGESKFKSIVTFGARKRIAPTGPWIDDTADFSRPGYNLREVSNQQSGSSRSTSTPMYK
jgi:hypothetical protein